MSFQREYEQWRKREESRAAGAFKERPEWKQKKRAKIVRYRDPLVSDPRVKKVFEYLCEHMAELDLRLLRFEVENLSVFNLYLIENNEAPEALLKGNLKHKLLPLKNVFYWARLDVAIVHMEKPRKNFGETRCVFEILSEGVSPRVRFKASFRKFWAEFADSLVNAVHHRAKVEKLKAKQAQAYEQQGYGAWA